MPKKKEKNPEEYYKGLIRSYKKRIAQLEKEIERLTYIPPSQKVEQENKKHNPLICESCGKGEMSLFEIMGRKFLICKICEHRIRLKNE